MTEYMPMVSGVLVFIQSIVGILIVIGAFLLQALGTDDETPRHIRWPLIGLTCWGFWFAFIGFTGHHDSPPALAFALAVAVVLLRYGRQIRGILDGESWWPKSRKGD